MSRRGGLVVLLVGCGDIWVAVAGFFRRGLTDGSSGPVSAGQDAAGQGPSCRWNPSLGPVPVGAGNVAPAPVRCARCLGRAQRGSRAREVPGRALGGPWSIPGRSLGGPWSLVSCPGDRDFLPWITPLRFARNLRGTTRVFRPTFSARQWRYHVRARASAGFPHYVMAETTSCDLIKTRRKRPTHEGRAAKKKAGKNKREETVFFSTRSPRCISLFRRLPARRLEAIVM